MTADPASPAGRQPGTGGSASSARGPVALVLAAIVSVQFGAAIATTLVREVGAPLAVVLRLGISAAVLVLLVRPHWRGRPRAHWIAAIRYGMALGLMNLSFYASLAYLPIGVAVTIEFAGPLVLAAVLSRRIRDGVAVLAAAAGVALASQAFAGTGSLSAIGIGYALFAGAMWAAYIVTSKAVGQVFPGVEGLAVALLVALVVAAPVATVTSWTGASGGTGAADGVAGVLWRGLGIAVLSSLIPYSLELLALRSLPAQVFGILLSLEPAVAALAGFLVLGQQLTPTQDAGMVLVVVASAIVLGSPARR